MATLTLLVLFFISLIFVMAAIIVPLRPALKDVGLAVATRGTLYFALIGIGFMMVEIGLLQRMTVFLGHPIYSLAVLLFSLILTTGMGSFLSEKVMLDNRVKITTWAILTGGYLMILPFVLRELFAAFNDATLVATGCYMRVVHHAGWAFTRVWFPYGHAAHCLDRFQTHALVLGDQRRSRRARFHQCHCS